MYKIEILSTIILTILSMLNVSVCFTVTITLYPSDGHYTRIIGSIDSALKEYQKYTYLNGTEIKKFPQQIVFDITNTDHRQVKLGGYDCLKDEYTIYNLKEKIHPEIEFDQDPCYIKRDNIVYNSRCIYSIENKYASYINTQYNTKSNKLELEDEIPTEEDSNQYEDYYIHITPIPSNPIKASDAKSKRYPVNAVLCRKIDYSDCSGEITLKDFSKFYKFYATKKAYIYINNIRHEIKTKTFTDEEIEKFIKDDIPSHINEPTTTTTTEEVTTTPTTTTTTTTEEVTTTPTEEVTTTTIEEVTTTTIEEVTTTPTEEVTTTTTEEVTTTTIEEVTTTPTEEVTTTTTEEDTTTPTEEVTTTTTEEVTTTTTEEDTTTPDNCEVPVNWVNRLKIVCNNFGLKNVSSFNFILKDITFPENFCEKIRKVNSVFSNTLLKTDKCEYKKISFLYKDYDDDDKIDQFIEKINIIYNNFISITQILYKLNSSEFNIVETANNITISNKIFFIKWFIGNKTFEQKFKPYLYFFAYELSNQFDKFIKLELNYENIDKISNSTITLTNEIIEFCNFFESKMENITNNILTLHSIANKNFDLNITHGITIKYNFTKTMKQIIKVSQEYINDIFNYTNKLIDSLDNTNFLQKLIKPNVNIKNNCNDIFIRTSCNYIDMIINVTNSSILDFKIKKGNIINLLLSQKEILDNINFLLNKKGPRKINNTKTNFINFINNYLNYSADIKKDITNFKELKSYLMTTSEKEFFDRYLTKIYSSDVKYENFNNAFIDFEMRISDKIVEDVNKNLSSCLSKEITKLTNQYNSSSFNISLIIDNLSEFRSQLSTELNKTFVLEKIREHISTLKINLQQNMRTINLNYIPPEITSNATDAILHINDLNSLEDETKTMKKDNITSKQKTVNSEIYNFRKTISERYNLLNKTTFDFFDIIEKNATIESDIYKEDILEDKTKKEINDIIEQIKSNILNINNNANTKIIPLKQTVQDYINSKKNDLDVKRVYTDLKNMINTQNNSIQRIIQEARTGINNNKSLITEKTFEPFVKNYISELQKLESRDIETRNNSMYTFINELITQFNDNSTENEIDQIETDINLFFQDEESKAKIKSHNKDASDLINQAIDEINKEGTILNNGIGSIQYEILTPILTEFKDITDNFNTSNKNQTITSKILFDVETMISRVDIIDEPYLESNFSQQIDYTNITKIITDLKNKLKKYNLSNDYMKTSIETINYSNDTIIGSTNKYKNEVSKNTSSILSELKKNLTTIKDILLEELRIYNVTNLVSKTTDNFNEVLTKENKTLTSGLNEYNVKIDKIKKEIENFTNNSAFIEDKNLVYNIMLDLISNLTKQIPDIPDIKPYNILPDLTNIATTFETEIDKIENLNETYKTQTKYIITEIKTNISKSITFIRELSLEGYNDLNNGTLLLFNKTIQTAKNDMEAYNNNLVRPEDAFENQYQEFEYENNELSNPATSSSKPTTSSSKPTTSSSKPTTSSSKPTTTSSKPTTTSSNPTTTSSNPTTSSSNPTTTSNPTEIESIDKYIKILIIISIVISIIILLVLFFITKRIYDQCK
jgi:hypothetical protein